MIQTKITSVASLKSRLSKHFFLVLAHKKKILKLDNRDVKLGSVIIIESFLCTFLIKANLTVNYALGFLNNNKSGA